MQAIQTVGQEIKASSQFSMSMECKPTPIVKNKLTLYLWGLSIAIGSLVMGYFFVIVTVLSSSLTEHYKNNGQAGQQNNISFLLSICTTAMPLGGLIGSLLYTQVINFIGSENKLMVYANIFTIVSLILQMISLDIYAYSAIRLLQGFITGLTGIVVPQYLMSISPTKVSGLMGSFNQFMITVGIAAAYAMGYTIDTNDLRNPFHWRLCVFFPIPFCIIMIITCKYFSFDSIERHIRNRDWKTLFEYIDMFYIRDSMSLETLVQSKNIDATKIPGGVPKDRQSANNLQQIEVNRKSGNPRQNEQQISPQSMQVGSNGGQRNENESRGLRLRQFLGIAISIMSQFSGINAILFYSNQLFLDISHGDVGYAVKKSMHLGIFQIIVTLISGGVMDRFGRRSLMICGETMIIMALLTGYYMLDFDKESLWDPQYVTYAIFVHMAGFSLSLGPIAVVYISEIVTDISPYMTLMWIETILISFVSNIMIEKFGTGKVFLFFAVISLAGLVYIWKFMLETKGKTRQQVCSDFQNFDTPIQNCLNSINSMIQDKDKKNYSKVNEGEK